MATYIPVYQKKIDYATGEVVFDDYGAPIMEYVRDIIVPDTPATVYLDLTPEELQLLENELLQQRLLYPND
jgi:hypothetical protein